jgi:hypothetical protein
MGHVLLPVPRYSAVSIVQPRRHIILSVTDAIKVVIHSVVKETHSKKGKKINSNVKSRLKYRRTAVSAVGRGPKKNGKLKK